MTQRSELKIELEKFVRQGVSKIIQVLIQSRLGERVATECKLAPSDNDWFHLTLHDLEYLLPPTETIFKSGTLAKDDSVFIEFSLTTAEKLSMVLEIWDINLSDPIDEKVLTSHVLYNRISLMIKSVICGSRVTPAYKLSRKQGPETYVFCYRIHQDKYKDFSSLGAEAESRCVGKASTPIGTFSTSVHYRTNLTFSPRAALSDIALKDNYFTVDMAHQNSNYTVLQRCDSSNYRSLKNKESDEGGCCPYSFSTSPVHESELPFCSTANKPKHLTEPGVTMDIRGLNAFLTGDLEPLPTIKDNEDSLPLQHFQCIELDGTESDTSSVAKSSEAESFDEHPDGASAGSTSCSEKSFKEEYVMVDMKVPFSSTDSSSDLGRFYLDCQSAPQLNMFQDQGSVEDTLNEITEQIDLFEENTRELESFMQSFESSGNDSD